MKPNWQWQLVETERPRQIGTKPLRNEVIAEGTLYARTSDVAKKRAFDAYKQEYEEKYGAKRIWLMPWVPMKARKDGELIVSKNVFRLIEHRHLFERNGIRMNLVLTKIKDPCVKKYFATDTAKVTLSGYKQAPSRWSRSMN